MMKITSSVRSISTPSFSQAVIILSTYFGLDTIKKGGLMSSALEQQINHLTAEIKKLKEAQYVAEKNVVNLVARSEFTFALISELIVKGTLERDEAIDFVKHTPVEISGFADNVEQARTALIQILSYANFDL
ncbi:hypothetical protein [Kosakonia sacchari]|uniref:hypothetical protein n=1 Tax=Kosakonia sacchari TaxID=1158459 RepID=UPI0013635A28|nr:hypothetical protein [Kosakonia sacchari]QHM95989.1 hypothetical protein FGE25_17725 [Kosakonia sacchari]